MDSEQPVENARPSEKHTVSTARRNTRRDNDKIRQRSWRRVAVRLRPHRLGRVASANGWHKVRARGQHQAELFGPVESTQRERDSRGLCK